MMDTGVGLVNLGTCMPRPSSVKKEVFQKGLFTKRVSAEDKTPGQRRLSERPLLRAGAFLET